MADSKLRVNLIGDASSLNRSLQIATARMDAFGKRATQIGKDLSLRLTLPIGLAAGAAIKMASDMEESTNKVRVAFGDSADRVEDFAKTALRSFGIAESSALDMTALFGDMATGMGVSQSEAANLSTSLVGLAGDLASFKNINIEEVTTALSGVFTGETESLKRLGIVMTEVNLEQFRMQQGIQKSVKEMTQQEKIMLRLNYIFKVTKNAQGDFARTSEGAANQMRIFQETIKEVGAELGAIMLPAFNNILTAVNELLDDFRNLDKGTQETIVNFGLLVAAIPPLIFAIGQITAAVNTLRGALALLAGTKITGPLATLLAALTLRGDEDRGVSDLLTQIEIENNQLEASLDEQERIANEGAKALDQLIREDLGVKPTPAAAIPPVFTKEQLQKLEADIDEFAGVMDYADAVASKFGIDEIDAGDTGFAFVLARDTAAVENFANTVADTAERVRTPMENIKDQVKGLSDGAVQMLMRLGSALQAAFTQMFNGESAIRSLGNAILDLVKQLAAAAAAAAIVAAIISAITQTPFSTNFKAAFAATSGVNIGGGNVGTPGTQTFVPNTLGGGNNINLTGQFRLDGQDLVVAVERANKARNGFI